MDRAIAPKITAHSSAEEISLDLSERRTGLSFQRTRMSADRTLMSVIRTSFSVIGFGFTVFQFAGRLLPESSPSRVPIRNFSVSLVLLGVAMLVLGIGYHLAFMRGLRKVRSQLTTDGLIHGESAFPASLTVIVAVLLLLLGLLATASIVIRIGI